jgi:hypothetical protein
MTDCRNSNTGNGEGIHQDSRSHTLHPNDPDLAFIVGLWDRLADECKARLIEVIRENLPSETLPTLSDQRSAVSDRNHREGQKVQKP